MKREQSALSTTCCRQAAGTVSAESSLLWPKRSVLSAWLGLYRHRCGSEKDAEYLAENEFLHYQPYRHGENQSGHYRHECHCQLHTVLLRHERSGQSIGRSDIAENTMVSRALAGLSCRSLATSWAREDSAGT